MSERERQVYASCHLMDHGEAARIADLFSPGDIWTSAGSAREERSAMAAAFQTRQDHTGRISRHIRRPEGWRFNTREEVSAFHQQKASLYAR
jgi:hypothetical protein